MLSADSKLSHYRILRPLGSGGMADVYEAIDERLGRHVALKVLPSEFGRNPSLVARFETEVRAAASLNHHGIVSVFEVGHDQGLHFFSMRLLTGGDLRQRIDRRPSLTETLAILREVSDAFSHAHARNFVHRDVKPENIMFDEQGYPVLTDFGIAKALESGSSVTATGVSIGTPRYISPEQARGLPVDARADLYSLGVILYEMLTGQPPYHADESLAVIFKHVTEPIPKLPAEHAGLQPMLEQLMAKDPAQRPASAKDLVKLIDAYLRKLPALKQNPDASQQNPLITRLMTASSSSRHSTPPSIDTEALEKTRQEELRRKEEEARQAAQARQLEDARRAEEAAALKKQEEAARLKAETDERVRQEAQRKAAEDEARRQLEAEAQRKAQEQKQQREAEEQRRAQAAAAQQVRKAPLAADTRDDDEAKTVVVDQATRNLIRARIIGNPRKEGRGPESPAEEARIAAKPVPPAAEASEAARTQPIVVPARKAASQPVSKLGEKRTGLPRGLPLIALICLGGAAAAYWLIWARPAADSVPAVIATPVVVPDAASGSGQAVPAETPAAGTSPVAPTVDPQAERIAGLLAAAGTDRKAGHDTSPPGDNALEKYQAVLALREDQAEARQGIRDIADGLAGAARQAIERSDFERAAATIDQIAAIQPQALGDLRDLLAARRAEAQRREAQNLRNSEVQTRPAAPDKPSPARAASSDSAAAARKGRSRAPAECADLMTKFGLGEDLTEKQRDFIRKNC